MRVLVAPDKFKGSLHAAEAGLAMGRGVGGGDPLGACDVCPLSDGGEGFDDVLGAVLGGASQLVTVTGPTGQSRSVPFRLLPDGSALIEVAKVIGLGLVPVSARTPTETTTFGVGELMRAALDAGARRIVLGVGGTATTDGGAGMAQALGVVFEGAPDRIRGSQLGNVRHVDARARDPRLEHVPVLALTDVDNPLTGPDGAAQRYGPQKGATPEGVAQLERALVMFAKVAGDAGVAPGDGAAGGLGYGLRLFASAKRQSGVDFVLDAVGFDARLEGVDLVLTGEGRLDGSSVRGKVVSGVLGRCARRGIPVVALAGIVEATADVLFTHGLTGAFSLTNGPMTEADALTHAAALLEELAANVVRVFAGRKRPAG
jgi:glycerate kinase